MKFMSKAENLCAVGLIVFFFFPWVSAMGGLISYAGYEIPDIVKEMAYLAAMASGAEKPDYLVYLSYLIYLMPIFSVLTIIFGVTGKSTKVTGFIAGLVPIAVFVSVFGYTLTQTQTDLDTLFAGMAIGAWLTLFVAVAMLLAVVGIIKMPAQATASSN